MTTLTCSRAIWDTLMPLTTFIFYYGTRFICNLSESDSEALKSQASLSPSPYPPVSCLRCVVLRLDGCFSRRRLQAIICLSLLGYVVVNVKVRLLGSRWTSRLRSSRRRLFPLLNFLLLFASYLGFGHALRCSVVDERHLLYAPLNQSTESSLCNIVRRRLFLQLAFMRCVPRNCQLSLPRG